MPQACCIALVLIAFATALPAKAAEPYPSKPIRLIVPFPPGGLSDGLARVIGQNLSHDWAQQVVIDNRPGAGTTARCRSRREGTAGRLHVIFSGHYHARNQRRALPQAALRCAA
jgi:tripartite-type tricarboxylate transporter receptor subunit TctC